MTNIFDMPKCVELRTIMLPWGQSLGYASRVPPETFSNERKLDGSALLKVCIKARSEGIELN